MRGAQHRTVGANNKSAPGAGRQRGSRLADRSASASALRRGLGLGLRRGLGLGLGQKADHARGVADGNGVGRKVSSDDGSGTDDRVLPDRDAGQHDDAAAEPHVVSDGDGLRGFPLLASGFGLDRVRGSQQLNVRADLNIVADGDAGDVECDKPVIGEAASANGDLVAVVHIQRRADLGTLPNRPEQLRDEPTAQRALPGRGGVVGGHEVLRGAELLADLGIVSDVEVPGKHPLAHRPGVTVARPRRHTRDRTQAGGRDPVVGPSETANRVQRSR